MKIVEFKPYEKNTLRGFFSLELANGIQIKDCTLHEKSGRAWFGFPGVPQIDRETGTVIKENGKIMYKNVIFVQDKKQNEALQKTVVAMLKDHLTGEEAAGDNIPV